MIRRAAVLSLLLAGPALAAPPLSSTSDNDAIHEEINAADPTISRAPAPIERLITAADLAEARLVAATEPGHVTDLLGLTAAARRVAYRRTGEARHLCQLLSAAEHVLAREGLPARLAAEARAFADEARAGLVPHEDAPCVQREESPPEVGPTTTAGPIAPRPPPAPAAPSPVVGRRRGLVAGGGVSLALAGLAGVGLIAVRAYRIGPYQEHAALVAAAEQAGGKTLEQEEALGAYKGIMTATRHATIGLAVSGVALAVLGGALVAAGKRRPTSVRARVAPYGGPYGAGLGMYGSF